MKTNRLLKPLLFVVNVLIACSVVCWPLAAFVTVFMFDAGFHPVPLAIAIIVWIYPAPVLIGAGRVWKNRKSDDISVLLEHTMVTASCPLMILLLFVMMSTADIINYFAS